MWCHEANKCSPTSPCGAMKPTSAHPRHHVTPWWCECDGDPPPPHPWWQECDGGPNSCLVSHQDNTAANSLQDVPQFLYCTACTASHKGCTTCTALPVLHHLYCTSPVKLRLLCTACTASTVPHHMYCTTCTAPHVLLHLCCRLPGRHRGRPRAKQSARPVSTATR